MESFNQFADSLDITFTCPHCHKEITHHIDDLPSPDWSGDTAASSENYDDDVFSCESCGNPFSVDIFVNIMDGEVVVTDMKTNKEVEIVRTDEYYLEEQEFEEE